MIQRVNGSLAVSRALGDYEYKQVEGKGPCEQLVSPEPEVSIIDRDLAGDEFVVLACDGIWDVMSNEELADFIHSRLRLTNDLTQVCNQVGKRERNFFFLMGIFLRMYTVCGIRYKCVRWNPTHCKMTLY